MLTAQGNSSF